MNRLPFEKQVRVVSALVEGCSLRSTERMHNVAHKTILRVCVEIGEACQRLHDALMMGLQVHVLELDEIWSFIAKKQRRLLPDDPDEMGDQYTFIGLDATRKAIVSYKVGKRTGLTTNQFAWDLRRRIVNRPQITSDGFLPYRDAIDMAFGAVDFAQVVKSYGVQPWDPKGREKCIKMDKFPVSGNPDPEKISTSYVERQNLTMRMGMRRFTRLTNAFSKKLRNHCAAIGLYVAHYNFCRVHQTLRTTPALAMEVTDHVWSIAELIDAALSIAPEPEYVTARVVSPPALPAAKPALPPA